jgi:hypothetical protein
MTSHTRIKSNKHQIKIQKSHIRSTKGIKTVIKLVKKTIWTPAYELKASSTRKLERTKEKIGLLNGPHMNNWR